MHAKRAVKTECGVRKSKEMYGKLRKSKEKLGKYKKKL